MKRWTASLAFVALAQPALAQGCVLERAVYAEPQNSYELRFRPLTSQESVGMVTHVFDLMMPNGESIPGRIATNMGISRDEGVLQQGCGLADTAVEQQGQESDCTIWRGVVYALGNGTADLLPFPQEPAPDVLLLADLGRQVRYRGPVSSPGEEPWDVFTFKGCAD